MNDEFRKALEAKSDQINNVDLTSGPMVITVTKVDVNSRREQPVWVSISESDKFYRPCKGMLRLLAAMWGDPENWIGRRIEIYRDPDVTFGRDVMGGIRISGLSDIDAPRKMAIPVSRGKVKEYTVKPLGSAAPIAFAAEDLSEAREAARRGTEAFRAWWRDNRGKQAAAKSIMTELQELCAAADSAADDEELPL